MTKALVIGNGESRSWYKPCHQQIQSKIQFNEKSEFVSDTIHSYFHTPTEYHHQPQLQIALRGDLWPGADHPRLRRQGPRRDPRGLRHRLGLRADWRRMGSGPLRSGQDGPATRAHRRQLLHQRQADWRCRWPTAVRRRPRLRHQRQGWQQAQPDEVVLSTNDQRDVRPAHRLELPVHGRRVIAPQPGRGATGHRELARQLAEALAHPKTTTGERLAYSTSQISPA